MSTSASSSGTGLEPAAVRRVPRHFQPFRGRAPRGRKAQAGPRRRGADLRHEITVPFATAIQGGEIQLSWLVPQGNQRPFRSRFPGNRRRQEDPPPRARGTGPAGRARGRPPAHRPRRTPSLLPSQRKAPHITGPHHAGRGGTRGKGRYSNSSRHRNGQGAALHVRRGQVAGQGPRRALRRRPPEI